MKYRILLIIFIVTSLCVKAQPPETIYPGTVVFEGYRDDTGFGPFNIGFDFTFFGNTYSQFYATSNGLITFGGTSGDYTEDPIPSTSTPNNFIAAFWDDIVIDGAGKILYTTIGAAPNRKCVVQWTNMGFYGSPILLGTFSAILYEGSNDIQIQYRSIIDNTSTRAHGGDASIGLENSTGSAGVSYAYHNSTAVASELAIRFSPSGSTYSLNPSATYDGIYLTKNMSLPEPGIPTLVSPPNNSTIGSSQTFEWTAASNASQYILKISTNSNISSSTDYNTGTATSYDISGLTLDRTYYWAVFAGNATGTTWSEIKRFNTSANPPLTPVPQTIWMEQGEERVVRIQYNGGDAGSKTAVISSLPAEGSLYQYDAGSKGALISAVPANITDPQMNIIYVADGSTGNGAGSFNFLVQDGTGDSPQATVTINVNAPGVPNYLLAGRSGDVEILFDRPMADPSGKESQFIVKVNGTPVTISSVALKEGDPFAIMINLATPLTGSETVLVSYTQGDVASEAGGLLSSFVDQPVNFLVQTVTFDPLPDMFCGDEPLTLTATASSGLPVTYTSSNTSVASISGDVLTVNAAGTTLITAQQVGDGTYAPAKYIRTLTVSKKDQTITFAPIDQKTYGDPDFNPGATASSSLPVTYTSDNTAVAQIDGNMIHITGAGTAVITAEQPGNITWNAAGPVQQTLTVVKAAQTITFGALSEAVYGSADIYPVVSSSSLLPVTLTSDNPAVATIVSDHIVINGTGSAVITASQPGNDNYLAAANVSRTLVVNKAGQTITFNPIDEASYGDADIYPGASSSSLLPVTYTSDNPSVASINGDHIVINGAGSALITASQPGNDNYEPADNVAHTLVVNKASQTITFAPLADAVYGDDPVTPVVSSDSGLEITLESSDASVATISDGMIVITGAGTAQITASQAGDQNYEPAENVTVTLNVNKADQTLTFTIPASVTYGAAAINAGASSSSGLAITWSSDNSSVAEVIDGQLYIRGAGEALITAGQAGDSNYNPATDVSSALTVSKASLTFTADDLSKNYMSANPELTFTVTGFVYDDDIDDLDELPEITTNAYQDSEVGTYNITFTGGSDDNYDFTFESGTLTVTKIQQIIVITNSTAELLMNSTFQMGATSTSGLPVLFESLQPDIASVEGSILTGRAAGTATIRVYNDGDVNYAPAEETFEVRITTTHRDIMNLFTPNNDGINDYWEIPGLDDYGRCEVKIYNRWGKLVFHSSDYHNEWDGLSDGTPVPPAAYYYIISTENSGVITGTVNIVR
jgi:gliding motility-associated-like protein